MASHEIVATIAGLVAQRIAASIDIDEVSAHLGRIRDDSVRSVHERAIADAFVSLAWDALNVRRQLSVTISEERAKELFTAALAASLHDRLVRRFADAMDRCPRLGAVSVVSSKAGERNP